MNRFIPRLSFAVLIIALFSLIPGSTQLAAGRQEARGSSNQVTPPLVEAGEDLPGGELPLLPPGEDDPQQPSRCRSCFCSQSQAVDGVYNVTCFGAIPNDEGDDTAAIQAAIDAVPEPELPWDSDGPFLGGEVYLPPGYYHVSDTLVLRKGITLRGAGPYATAILYKDADGTKPCLLIGNCFGVQKVCDAEGACDEPCMTDCSLKRYDPSCTQAYHARYVQVRDLAIIGEPDSNWQGTSGPAIKMAWAHGSDLQNLLIKQTKGGIFLWNAFVSRFTNVSVNTMYPDVGCTGTDPCYADAVRLLADSNSFSMVGCRLGAGMRQSVPDATARSLYIGGVVTAASILNTTFDSADIGIQIGTNLNPDPVDPSPSTPQGVTVSGGRFEIQKDELLAYNATGLVVTGGLFSSSADLSATPTEVDDWVPIKLHNVSNSVFSGNSFFGNYGSYDADNDGDLDPIRAPAAIKLMTDETNQIVFAANFLGGNIKKIVEGNTNADNVFYLELMNGGGAESSHQPFRTTGAQSGYMDIGAVKSNYLYAVEDYPPGDSARDRVGRLYVRKDDMGTPTDTLDDKLQLWTCLGNSKIKLAGEGETLEQITAFDPSGAPQSCHGVE